MGCLIVMALTLKKSQCNLRQGEVPTFAANP
jgi:hypothetical protein